MPRGNQRPPRGQGEILARLRELLKGIPADMSQDPQQIRADTLRLAELTEGLRALSRARLHQLSASRSGKDRILTYLKMFVGQVVDGQELHVVAGIQESARRIRQLRVESGYSIVTGYSRDDLRPDQYVLETVEPNEQEAQKWRTANEIRRRGGSARDKMLALLRAYVGQPVTTEQLAYVAPGRDKRRVRELRTQLGWRVVTRQSGRPDLPANVYVLESEDQLPPHDRTIPDNVYDGVLVRDGQRCRRCGWSVDQRAPSARKQFLEVHHVEHHRDGGANNSENLVTLCNVDHDEVHRLDLKGQLFWLWLKEH